MKTIYQLQQIAARLRAVTEVNSISPEDTFGLQADVLEYLADMEQNAEGLGIHKVYASYAAMVADASAPVGSNGKALRFGQLVVIYNSANTTQAESGNVYAWQKGNTGAAAWLLMGNLISVLGNPQNGYYVCDTAAATAEKEISATGYVLSVGGSMKVKMANANTADNATLNINSTGEKALYYAGERTSSINTWEAGETVEVYYDGTSYYANNVAGGSGSGDGVFDVSVKYPTSGVEGGNTYTLEGALAVLNANLSASKKKGGMSIKFVQSSDNKYVQFRYMGTDVTTAATFTNTANWQGVDDVPTAGSENLVKSAGLYNKFNTIEEKLSISISYNNENFTDGRFYNLSEGVGGTPSTNSVASYDFACLRIKVKAGQAIDLKTIGGRNGRAYALTDVNRTILSVASANADFSSGITLNVEQDGYLYVNTTTEFLPNVSVVVLGLSRFDILEDDVSELQGDVSELQGDVSELQGDVSELQNDLSANKSYNNENFTDGRFYNLSEGVGGTASTNPVASSDYACLRIEVKAGQAIDLKTIGGRNGRAYALTDVNRTILSVASANADFSSGITLNVEQDGYLYVNTTTEFLPNVSVVVLGLSRFDILEDDVSELEDDVSELEDDVSELQDDVSELQDDVSELQASVGSSKIFNPHFDLTKNDLKILDIGNSFTQDTTHYLPNIIANYNIPNTYSLYQLIRGGSSFKTWVDCYNNNDILGYFCSLITGQTLADVSTGNSEANDGTLFRNVLNSVKWDMIIIHQVSTYSADYTLWEGNTNSGYLKEYIRILKLTNPQAKIGFYLVHSAPSNSDQNPEHSSLLRWQKIAKSVKWMMANYGVDFVIPYGTAIQNVRQCSIIDSNELSDDGRHNANGLADYTAACCYFQQLFGARNGVNVIGDTFRITVDETVAGQISVTDDTAPLAQKAAILACCDAFSISNPEENIL